MQSSALLAILAVLLLLMMTFVAISLRPTTPTTPPTSWYHPPPLWSFPAWSPWRRTAHAGGGYVRPHHHHHHPDRPPLDGGGGGGHHHRRHHGRREEGLVAFEADKGLYDSVVIDLYDPARAIYKLTDSLYFDHQNGNLIEVIGRALNGSAGEALVSRIAGATRANASIAYSRPTGSNQIVACAESKLPLVESSNKWFSYVSQGYTNADRYLVCYAAWGTYTYLHVINTATLKHVSSHRIPSAQSGAALDNAIVYNSGQSTITYQARGNVGGAPLDPRADQAPPTAISGYSREVYRVGTTAYFDVTNGYLVFTDPGRLDVSAMYDRWGALVSPDSAPATSVTPRLSFTAFCVVQGNELFVYMAFDSDTVILCIRNASADVANPVFSLFKVSLYNQSGAGVPGSGSGGGSGSAGGGNTGGGGALGGVLGGSGGGDGDGTLLAALLLALLQQGEGGGGDVAPGAGGDGSLGGGASGGGGGGVTPVGQSPLPRVPGPATALTTTGAIVDLNDYVLKSSIIAPVFPITSVVALPPGRQSAGDKNNNKKLPPGSAPAADSQTWSGVWPGSQRVTTGGNPNQQSVIVDNETTTETSDVNGGGGTSGDTGGETFAAPPRRNVRGVNPLSRFGALTTTGGANFRRSAASISL